MASWTTEEMPERDQFSYWREVLCEAYIALDPIRPSTGGFAGKVTAHPLSAINVTTIASTRQRIFRGPSEISRMPKEVYFLNLQTRGQCLMCQDGREALIGPGEFSLVDSTKPYLNDYCSDDWEQLSFRIPRHVLRPRLRNPEQATALRIAGLGGMGGVAVEFLRSLTHNVERLSPMAAGISESMVDIVALALGAHSTTEEASQFGARQAMYASILNYINTHIADPEISPIKAAAFFKVSPRYVHKLLEHGGKSFGRIVLERRLERCAKDFSGPDGAAVSEVALRWGFNDLSHFSRTFRQHFGMSPREYRQQQAIAAMGL